MVDAVKIIQQRTKRKSSNQEVFKFQDVSILLWVSLLLLSSSLIVLLFLFLLNYNHVHGLLTKRKVKMAKYWPSYFFVCLWTETKSRSINTQKKERGQYPAILTSLVNKRFIICDKKPKNYL